MRVLEEFLNDIKMKNRDFILKKLKYFSEAIINSNCLNNIPKGFWIRRIAGTDIYKFRVNNGDRILFTFDNKNNYEIVFLKYCNHDRQILKGKEINNNLNLHLEKTLDLDLNPYEEDEIDENIKWQIEDYIKKYTSLGLENLMSIVLEDEYIAIALEEDSDEYLYYLNESQFECLKILGKPIIISGCAGSGKTMIGIHKLISNNELNIKSAYMTYSPLLKYQSEKYFNKFKKSNNSSIDFICINDYFLENLNINESNFIKFNEFEEWFLKNCSRMNKLNLDYRLIYNEISNKNTYLNYTYEDFNDKEIDFINKVYEMYESWINENNYIDEIRLVKQFNKFIENKSINLPKYDFIFVDEIQDLRKDHIEFLYKILDVKENIIFAGDINQIINNSNFNFNLIKSFFYNNQIDYEEKFINKNYRNTSGVVSFINKLINLRIKKVGKSKDEYDQFEEHIREGKKPYIISYKLETIKKIVEYVNDRDYCAIIVPNYAEKHKLIIDGADDGRIFTVDEIKGIEYKNIFCINFISTYNNYWKEIKKGLNRHYLRHFVNILYVAITRGINIVGFIEKDVNLMKDLFGKDSIEEIKEINLDLLEMTSVTTEKGWLKEAIRLEESLNYGKAYYAYKKAKNKKGMLRCKTKIESIRGDLLTKFLGKENETAIRIENSTGSLTYNDVSYTLNKIFNKHFAYTQGNIKLVFQDNNGSILITNLKDISKYRAIEDISNTCESTIKGVGNIKRNKVTIHMNLFYNGSPLRLKSLEGEDINLIRAEIYKSKKKSNSIKFSYEYIESLNVGKALNKIFNEFSDIDDKEDSYTDFDDKFIEEIVNELMQQANNDMLQEKYDNAIKSYKIILEEKFDEYMRAIKENQKINYAISNLEKKHGIKIKDDIEFEKYYKAELTNNIGLSYKAMGKNDEAYKYLKMCIEYSTVNMSNVYLNIGDIHMDRKEYDLAYYYFDKGLKEGNSRGYKGIALVKSYKGEQCKAMDNFNKFLEEFPMDIDGHIKRVECFMLLLKSVINNDSKYSYLDIDKYIGDARKSNQLVKNIIPNIVDSNLSFQIFDEIFS